MKVILKILIDKIKNFFKAKEHVITPNKVRFDKTLVLYKTKKEAKQALRRVIKSQEGTAYLSELKFVRPNGFVVYYGSLLDSFRYQGVKIGRVIVCCKMSGIQFNVLRRQFSYAMIDYIWKYREEIKND